MNELFQKRGPVDMSPAGIAQRLRDLQQLYLFSMSLSRARFVDPQQEAARQRATDELAKQQARSKS